MAKNITQPETPELFTVYYMNQEKVFEMRMLLDNRLPKENRGERVSSTAGQADIDVQTDAAMPFLARLQGSITGSIGHEKQAKMVDTLEYIHTKSRMLSDIIAQCTVLKGESACEDDLVYIAEGIAYA